MTIRKVTPLCKTLHKYIFILKTQEIRSPRKYKEVQNMEMLNLQNIAIVIEFHNLKTCMQTFLCFVQKLCSW